LGGTAGVNALVPDFSGARAFFISLNKFKVKELVCYDRWLVAMARFNPQ